MQRMFKGNVGIYIDYEVADLDLATATSVSFLWRGPHKTSGSLAASVVPGSSVVRYITTGSEFTIPGVYELWPHIETPSFKGEVKSIKILVEAAG